MPERGAIEMKKTRSQVAEMTPTALRTLSLAKRSGKMIQMSRSSVMMVKVSTDNSGDEQERGDNT